MRRQRCGYCGRWIGGPLGIDGPGACAMHADLPELDQWIDGLARRLEASILGGLVSAERTAYSRPLMHAEALISGLAPEAEQATREREA